MSSYEDEAIEVARDLIRLDTTNHSTSGSETLAAEYGVTVAASIAHIFLALRQVRPIRAR